MTLLILTFLVRHMTDEDDTEKILILTLGWMLDLLVIVMNYGIL